MKSTIVAVIILFISTIIASAQNNYAVRGAIVDTASNIRMDNATVCVLNAKDSILQKFTYSNKGNFTINNLKQGKFLLLITYPGYADYVENFALDVDHPSVNFSSINMILQSRLLKEVIIKARVTAIRIKGDTTEFNAAAYATQKNAKVEDLLKQLQGMQVDQSGKITFQGQAVDKVLIDGEEFFGDDPTLVTKNVRADMVDKVQVYDRKSDMAKQTGIDDGIKLKTINIQLKEDKRKGIFGKVEGDYGSHDYYVGQAMFNRFNNQEKYAAYGNIGNTGKVGLSGDDSQRFGTGGGSGNYGGGGIPLARDGGAHYSNSWNQSKQSINTDYKIGALTVDGTKTDITQNNLPGNYNTINAGELFHNYSFKQSLNARYNNEIDSTSSIFLSLSGSAQNGNSNSANSITTLRGNGVLQNINSNNLPTTSDSKSLFTGLFYNKRLKKMGRSISVSFNSSLSRAQSNSFLISKTDFYNNQAALDSSRNINQYKTFYNKGSSLSTSLTYTEPFSKSISLSLNYNISITNSNNDRQSFNRSDSTHYNLLVDSLSNNFKLNQLSNGLGADLRFFSKKTSFSLGTAASKNNFKQTDELAGTALTRNFINWNPHARFNYNFTSLSYINLSYNGSTSQPAIDQIQPVKVNDQPLNIMLGNPDLKPQFYNNVYIGYSISQVTGVYSFYINGSYSNIIHPIVLNRVTDSAGVSTSQYSNLKNKQPSSWNLNTDFTIKIKPLWDITFGLGFFADGSVYYNYTNNLLNQARAFTYKPRFHFAKYTSNYGFNVWTGPNYTINTSSLQKQVNNNGFGYNTTVNYNIHLPAKFFIGSDADILYIAKTQAFDTDFRKFILNAYMGRSFLKDESLKLYLLGNDLLNQNTGYSRSGTANNFTQSSYTTIKRNFLFAITWDFSKFGKLPEKK
jgi:hypothetical protein